MLRGPSKLAISFACALAAQGQGVVAAEWTSSAAVAPKIIYTDNVCLSEDNEESEYYGVVTPSFDVVGNGNRANVALAASVDVSTLSDGDLRDKGCENSVGDADRDNYLPDVRARGDAILVDQWLYLDVHGSASQNAVNPFVAGGNDEADRRGNVNTTYRYNISPYIKRRVKNVGDLLLRVAYDDQTNSKDTVADSTEESANVLFSSGSDFSPFSWSLQGDYSNVEYDSTDRRDFDDDSELKSAQFNLAYQLSRKWQVNGFYGDEWNDFVSSRDDIDGTFWGAGLTWTPNTRTVVEAGTGDRFFGTTPWLRIDHTYRRSNFSLDYAQTLTYSRNIRTLGVDDGLSGQPTTQSNSPILDERLTLGYKYIGRRFTLGLTGNYSEQTRQGGGVSPVEELEVDESRHKSIILRLQRPLAKNLDVRTHVSWREQEPKNDETDLFTETETWNFGLGADRTITDRLSASLQYNYIDRQSNNRRNEYQENRITFLVRASLL